jgi:hypothetical protein
VNPKCHFVCANGMDEAPIVPMEMPPPPVGTLLFFEGEDHGYRVTGLQYQFRKTGTRYMPHILVLVNVLLVRVDPR